MPYVFLITDGAVDNERAICEYAGATAKEVAASGRFAPRINAIAIGRYCNHLFLKQLAVFGRGQFEVALRPHNIRAITERMLTSCAQPVLTNISITVPGAPPRLVPRLRAALRCDVLPFCCLLGFGLGARSLHAPRPHSPKELPPHIRYSPKTPPFTPTPQTPPQTPTQA